MREFFTVLDELWRALRVDHGLVDRADGLTRLNRQKGTGTAFITRSLADLEALPTAHDRAKARGFAERSAVHHHGRAHLHVPQRSGRE